MEDLITCPHDVACVVLCVVLCVVFIIELLPTQSDSNYIRDNIPNVTLGVYIAQHCIVVAGVLDVAGDLRVDCL